MHCMCSGLSGVSELSAIAVTAGPGLSPCLDVGLIAARDLCLEHPTVDYLQINHLEVRSLAQLISHSWCNVCASVLTRLHCQSDRSSRRTCSSRDCRKQTSRVPSSRSSCCSCLVVTAASCSQRYCHFLLQHSASCLFTSLTLVARLYLLLGHWRLRAPGKHAR